MPLYIYRWWTNFFSGFAHGIDYCNIMDKYEPRFNLMGLMQLHNRA
jgi:hypothetical protein